MKSKFFPVIFIFICGVIGGSLSADLFPLGSTQIYTFENDVILTDLENKISKPAGYSLKGSLKCSSVWKKGSTQLLSVQVESPILSVFDEGPQNKYVNVAKDKFYVVLDNTKPSRLYAGAVSKTSNLNLIRGIASLFHLGFESGPFVEEDSAGTCSGFYVAYSSTKYQKTKTDCSRWDMKVHFRSEVPLGLELKSLQTIDYELSHDGILLNVNSLETHSYGLNSKPDVGSKILSKFVLQHKSSINEENVNSSDDLDLVLKSLGAFNEIGIEFEVDGAISTEESSFTNILNVYKNQLNDKHIGEQTLALAFAELLPAARNTKSEEFIEILKSSSYKSSRNQLIDLMGAVQTEEAHRAFFSIFNVENEANVDVIERYLQSLSVGTRPVEIIVQDLFLKLSEEAVTNYKLKDTLTQTLAALSGRLASFIQNGFENQLIRDIKNLFLSNLSDCSTPDCKEIYIRALQNFRDTATVPVLFQIAVEGETKTSVAALKALQVFPVKYFTEANNKSLQAIFYQVSRKFDSTSRALALDILLKMKPTKKQLLELLMYLNSNDPQFEVKTYLLQNLRMISEKCTRFAALLLGALKELPSINNYDVIAQKGLTTVLQRSLSKFPAYNETLVSVQEIFNGVLKRGSVDLVLNAEKENFSSFKLGIYTSGLASFVGDSGYSDEVDDSPATAGMEICVQDVQFRPLVFFNGQSELMGHVWSGTASDPTAAYQATTLMHDHEHYITLQNGGTAYVRIAGSRSINLFGQIDFSLWNRNAHTEISQNSGNAVLGSMTFSTSYAKLANQFTLISEPKINVVADVDFYSTVLLCIQLTKPNMEFRHSTESSLQLTEGRYSKKYLNTHTHKIPGSTLALNQKNNEMCNKILSS